MNCNVYNVRDYGAFPSDSLQTENIQKAIDECFLNGGGKVIVPCGIYFVSCIRLRSNVTLYLESGAILKGVRDPDAYLCYKNDKIEPITEYAQDGVCGSVYPFSRWNNAIIRVIDAKNVSIIGEKGSYIDGSNCYDALGEEKYRGPHAINIQNSENIYLDGYSIIDSSNWAHAIFISKNITVRNLKVYGGHDGFDVRTCDNVLIENCEFYTGDDCIAGFDNHDVVIRNCIFESSCSAMRFGGNNVLVENCKGLAPAKYGFRGHLSPEKKEKGAETDETCRHNMHTTFNYYCDFRAVLRKTPGNILVRNCEFINPDSVIRLEFDGKHQWCCNRSLAQIKFESCKFLGVNKPIYLYCDEKEPIDFTLENVEITAREGFENEHFLEAINYAAITLKNVKIGGYTDPTALLKTEGKLEFTDTSEIKIERTGEMGFQANAPITK